MPRIPVLVAMLLALPAHAGVNIEWVTVGDPGNACDTQFEGCFGAVSDEYRIGKYEVTYTQYTEFLNAVAVTDTNMLYDTNMGSSGGITQSGISGSFTYSTILGYENMPVLWITFFDSLRFANWLHNRQPTGPQDNTTTENGAYTITPAGIAANSITRNAGATVFLTSEDEWYKAAYYDTVGMSYFEFPAGSDTPTACSMPGATANTANCFDSVGNPSDVGSYTASASPNDSFDQGGNALEWNEGIIGSFRSARGGTYTGGIFGIPNTLSASFRYNFILPESSQYLGFRVASLVPPIPSLSPIVLTVFGTLLALVGWRTLRS